MRTTDRHVLIIIMFSHLAEQCSVATDKMQKRGPTSVFLHCGRTAVASAFSFCCVVLHAQSSQQEGAQSAMPQAPKSLVYSCSPGAENDTVSVTRFGAAPDIERFIASDIEVAANELLLQADSAIYDGQVDLRRGDLYLHADRASLDLESQNIQLLGGVEVALPGARLEGDSASINLNNNASIISGAEYFIQDAPSMTGSAGSVAVDENRVVSITDGTYTRCDPDKKQWEIAASELRLDPESGQGFARGATVSVLDTPIVYIPRLRFPIGDQRQSGFLFPSLARRSDGLDISIPYYFNLASNYDFLLAPRYRAGRGYLTEAQLRWMNRYDTWALNTLFIDSDDSLDGASRWAISVDEVSHWTGGIRSRVTINRVSDADVPRDLQSNNFSITRSSALSMSGQLEWFHRYGVLGAAINRYQSIDTTFEIPNEKLPEIWADFAVPARRLRPGMSANLQYTAFEADSLIAATGDNSVQRTRGEVEFFYNINQAISRWRIGFGSEFRYYALEENASSPGQGFLDGENSAWINVPAASIQWSSDWVRESGLDTGGTTELLQPQISYRYRTLEVGSVNLNQLPSLDAFQHAASASELYEDGQFGGDSLDPRSHLRVALRYSRTSSSRSDAAEPASMASRNSETTHVTLGALNYFQRKLPNADGADDFSSQRRWFLEAATALSDHWRARSAIVWSQDDAAVDYASAHLQYQAGQRAARSPVFNLGYQRREDTGRFDLTEDVEHVDLSAAYPVLDRWALFGRVQYDTVNRRHTEGLAGFEFNDCCFKLRLLYRDGIVFRSENESGERDRAFLLQIQLKGLGGLGSSVDELLARSIKGFTVE